MLTVYAEENVMAVWKRTPTSELATMIIKMHDEKHMTFQEITDELEKKRITGPRAEGALARISVNDLYNRYKAREVTKVSYEDPKLNVIRKLLTSKSTDREKVTMISAVIGEEDIK